MEYDRYATAVRQEYVGFSNDLITEYLARTVAGRGVESVGSFRVYGLGKVAALLARVLILTNDYLAPTDNGTLRDPRDHVWTEALRHVAIKNVNDLIVRLMGGSGRLADTLTRPAGAVGFLLQRKVARPELIATDRSGRKWQSEQLVAVMARDFAYQVYLDATINQLEQVGMEWVRVIYPNADHTQHGLVLHLSEIGLVRKTIFHPNSHARLVPHVPT